jgi:hypothetical protein
MRKGAALLQESSITCPIQSGTVYEKSVSSRVGRSPRWFARAPASVSLDNSLSDGAFRAYCVMGLKTKGPLCSVGLRHLGKVLGLSKNTANRRVRELIKAGHLEMLPRKNGGRAQYRFTSPAFLKSCATCKRFTQDLSRDGLCWVCSAHKEALSA